MRAEPPTIGELKGLARPLINESATLPAHFDDQGHPTVTIILVIALLVILFGGGGYGYRRYGPRGAGGVLGLVLVIVLILWLLGQL
jgi:hypothetical protein